MHSNERAHQPNYARAQHVKRHLFIVIGRNIRKPFLNASSEIVLKWEVSHCYRFTCTTAQEFLYLRITHNRECDYVWICFTLFTQIDLYSNESVKEVWYLVNSLLLNFQSTKLKKNPRILSTISFSLFIKCSLIFFFICSRDCDFEFNLVSQSSGCISCSMRQHFFLHSKKKFYLFIFATVNMENDFFFSLLNIKSYSRKEIMFFVAVIMK